MKKLPLVIVNWVDITTCQEWAEEDRDYTNHGAKCISVGWQLKSNKKTLVLAPMRTDMGICGDRQIIPRGCITSLRRIE